MTKRLQRVVESYGRQLQIEDAHGQRALAMIKSKKTTALVGDWVDCHHESDTLIIDTVAQEKMSFFDVMSIEPSLLQQILTKCSF